MARLLDILATRHPDTSRRTLRQMLAHGRVTVDGRIITRANVEVPEGADVALGRKTTAPSERKAVDIVYEDRHLLVIDKPAGVLSVTSGTGGTASAWADVRRYLARAHQEPYLVHRLDKPASGLLVFAKSAAVQKSLEDTFARHDLERVYRQSRRQPTRGRWGHHDALARVRSPPLQGAKRAGGSPSGAPCHGRTCLHSLARDRARGRKRGHPGLARDGQEASDPCASRRARMSDRR